MRTWPVPTLRIFGVEVRIHWTFLFLLVFVWATEAAGQGARSGRVIALVAIIFGSVVLHELGHAIAALHSGISVRSIVLLPLGGVTLFDESAQRGPDPTREFSISLAGPIVNLLIAFVSGSIVFALAPEVHLWARPWVHSNNLLRSLVWINLFLGAVNLLPAYPMDGGRMLRAAFSRRMDPVVATRRAVTIGQAFAMMFMFAGIWNTWLVLIGFFLFIGAQLEDRSAVFQSVLESVRLGDIMLTDFRTLSPADTLEDALDKAVHSLQDDFPVVRGSDMVGVVSRHKILEALRLQGNGYVQPIMNRLFEISDKDDSLASAFRKITGKGLTIIPVVDGGRLVGIVTLQNLMHSMALLAESRKLHKEALES